MVHTHAITIEAIPLPDLRRINTIRARLGRKLHPAEITDAWYAQDCPPRLDTNDLPFTIRVRWRLACALRGVKP